MKATRPILGWLSWYIVATVLYAIVWTQIDTDLRFAMPANLVLPLSDFLGARSAENTYDVYVWSTSIVAVVCLHLGACFVWRYLKTAGYGEGSRWRSCWRLVSGIVGWMCWLLVSTAALLVVGDEISDARGVRPSGDAGQQSVEFVVGVFVVALLHLAAVKAHRRHAAWRRGPMAIGRQFIGWISWLIVAAHIYAFTWWSFDIESYYVLPKAVYRWLDEWVGPTSCEESADLDDWSTATVMVLALHVVVLVGLWILRRTFLRQRIEACDHWRRRIFAFTGWSSWLLVATVGILIAADYLLRALGSKLPSNVGAVLIEMTAGLCIVGSLHLAALRIARRQRS